MPVHGTNSNHEQAGMPFLAANRIHGERTRMPTPLAQNCTSHPQKGATLHLIP